MLPGPLPVTFDSVIVAVAVVLNPRLDVVLIWVDESRATEVDIVAEMEDGELLEEVISRLVVCWVAFVIRTPTRDEVVEGVFWVEVGMYRGTIRRASTITATIAMPIATGITLKTKLDLGNRLEGIGERDELSREWVNNRSYILLTMLA
jgi:hypothetical protein